MTSIRTLELTERRPRVCRLARADLDFLLEHHRAHIEVAFTGRRGRYRLTPRGVAGVIALPNVQLQIRPKIAPADLLFLLDAADITLVPAGSDAVPSGLPDLLAGRLVQLIRERTAAGLHRGYVEQSETLSAPRGRLDIPALARDATARRDRLPCRFEEFTADVRCNQLVKATAERVLNAPGLGDPCRFDLRQTLAAFAEIGPIDLDAGEFTAALADSLTTAYRPLLELCRLLAEATAPGPAGSRPCPAFLLDLEQVFERYITRGIVEAFADTEICVEVQPWTPIHDPILDQTPLRLRPDIVLRRARAAVAVIDAKWKRFSGTPDADDLHQILAYAVALGAPRVALVYPGRRLRTRDYPLAHAPVTVSLRTVRVAGEREKCRRSLHRFARSFAFPP